MIGAECPSISVVMATQARSVEYFREAVDSILRQTEQNFELVIVFDGCSQRAIEAALEGYDDRRIRSIQSAKNRGLARSLNLAIRLARGAYLARMDDDDRSLPERFRRQVAVMKRGDFDVLGANAYVIDSEGKRVDGAIIKTKVDAVRSPFGAVFGNIFIHPAVMMRRDWALKNRYDPNWGRGQDRELWVRAALQASYGCIESPLLEYRRPTETKAVQVANVRSAYKLIWRNRRRFGAHVPLLVVMNVVRHIAYIVRMAWP